MLRLTSMLFAGVMASLVLVPSAALAQAGQPTVEGLWQHKDSSGQPQGWFRIQQRNGVYEGQIVKMFPEPGEDPSQWRCSGCEGEQKDAPVLGITFIKGMKRDGLRYDDGTILDPRDGSVYDAQMELSPDGKRLTVRGYVGISLFGKSQVWDRLPDTALDDSKPASPNTGSAGKPRTAPRR